MAGDGDEVYPAIIVQIDERRAALYIRQRRQGHAGRIGKIREMPVAVFAIGRGIFIGDIRNVERRNFTDVSDAPGVALSSLPYVKWGTAFVDLDNDGWVDLITVTGHVYPQVDSLPSGATYREPKLLRMNHKDGTFCDASDQAGPALLEKRVSRGLAVADLFNDGNMDVVISDIDGAPMILKNQ